MSCVEYVMQVYVKNSCNFNKEKCKKYAHLALCNLRRKTLILFMFNGTSIVSIYTKRDLCIFTLSVIKWLVCNARESTLNSWHVGIKYGKGNELRHPRMFQKILQILVILFSNTKLNGDKNMSTSTAYKLTQGGNKSRLLITRILLRLCVYLKIVFFCSENTQAKKSTNYTLQVYPCLFRKNWKKRVWNKQEKAILT